MPIIINFSKSQRNSILKVLIGILLIFVIQGIFLYIDSNDNLFSNLGFKLFSYLMMAIFIIWLYFSINIVLKIKNNKPQLILDETGITSFGLLTSKNFLKWSDIDYIKLKTINFSTYKDYNNVDMLLIKLKKDCSKRKYNGIFYKILLWCNLKLIGFEISYPKSLFEDKLPNVIRLLENNIKILKEEKVVI